MLELIVQILEIILILSLITYMVYKTYNDPHSEYGKLLDEIPDTYSHLSDKALKAEIAKAKKVLHRLELELEELPNTRRSTRHRLRKKIASIKLALLHNEEANRAKKNQF